jgi:hypothetical protein
VRVKLNNGERVVGVRYPAILVPHVEKIMKEKCEAEQLVLQAVSTSMIQAENYQYNTGCK